MIAPSETSARGSRARNGARLERSGGLRAWLVTALCACALDVATLGSAHALSIHLNTSALAGVSGRLEFSLFDGDFTLGNNTVTISNLVTDGTLGAVDCSLGCAGGPPYTLDETAGLGQLLQDLTLGLGVDFDLTYTTNFVSNGANAPDRLVLNLLDPATNLTLVDTDLDALADPIPYQDALLVLDLVAGGQPRFPTRTDPIGPPNPPTVPEPPAAALLALGIVVLAGRHLRRPGGRVVSP
jgi:hypothetical protein